MTRLSGETPEPMMIPLPEKRPPGWIPIEKVSNGCGGGILVALQNWIGDDSKFHNGNPFDPAFKVDFREACNLHDAAYSGALVWDSIKGEFTDFRGTTQKQADDKLQTDMDRLCEAKIPARWETALANCKAGAAHWIFVRTFGRLTFRERIDFSGAWENESRGWPMCDAVLARPWTITHKGRTVIATWQEEQGDKTLRGRFEGVLVTGDKVGDDRIEGTFKITGGPNLPEGPMTLTVTSADSFDFGGSGARMARTTQSASAAVSSPHRCRFKVPPATTTTPSPPASQAGSYTLSSTKVTNPNAPELTIDAAGGKAIWDHCCDGGKWKVEFSFQTPGTLNPGKTFSITIGIKVESQEPNNPNSYQIGARAPDFTGAVNITAPATMQGSRTFTVPFSASYKDSPNIKDVYVVIGVVSAEVTFIYHRA